MTLTPDALTYCGRYCHRSVDGWRANKKEKSAAEKAARQVGKGDGDSGLMVEPPSYAGEDT
eukprot:SAG11_NODE_29759_length_307_cov_1.245192_1_plen_60_part_01